MMKVLHVNAGLETGGGLTHIINLLTAAKQAGQDFTLLCLMQGPVARAAQAAGLQVEVLEAKGRYDLSSLRRLVRLIKQGDYDIVHTHGARANLFIYLIRHRIRAKWCVTVHSDPYLDFADHGFKGKFFTAINLHALRKADSIFAITQKFADLLTTKAKVAQDKVQIIYNGTWFHANNQLQAKKAHPHFNIINVARAEKIKGQELLLQAFKNLLDPNARLFIAGEGTELQRLKKLARELELTEQVTFLGFVSQEQLAKLYCQMDLAALTSYSESFPLVLLEASDNLVPILSTRVGDIEMMVPDQAHGFIAEVGDVDSITAALKDAIKLSPAKRQQIAQAEKEYVTEHFSLEKQLTGILQGYQALLQAK